MQIEYRGGKTSNYQYFLKRANIKKGKFIKYKTKINISGKFYLLAIYCENIDLYNTI